MHNTSHKDFACLLNILESISKIKTYISQYKNADELQEDTKSFDAVMMNFVVIGEMAEKLSETFKLSTETKIDWYKIIGFRNIIAHNYFGIDVEEVWQIIHNSLVGLEKNIKLLTE
ncbi:MAG: HepT-like ribonuclease domain-containing protein [Salinivirgaceae bacterium]|jgi:uncharacterized protein with HEPN domain